MMPDAVVLRDACAVVLIVSGVLCALGVLAFIAEGIARKVERMRSQREYLP